MKIIPITTQQEAEMWNSPKLKDRLTYIYKRDENTFGIRGFVFDKVFYVVYDKDSIVMKVMVDYIEENRVRAEAIMKGCMENVH